MPRHPNLTHNEWRTPDGQITWEHVIVEVLQDIRDEMKQLNRVFACYNFQRIPRVLDRISANTRKKKKKKATP